MWRSLYPASRPSCRPANQADVPCGIAAHRVSSSASLILEIGRLSNRSSTVLNSSVPLASWFEPAIPAKVFALTLALALLQRGRGRGRGLGHGRKPWARRWWCEYWASREDCEGCSNIWSRARDAARSRLQPRLSAVNCTHAAMSWVRRLKAKCRDLQVRHAPWASHELASAPGTGHDSAGGVRARFNRPRRQSLDPPSCWLVRARITRFASQAVHRKEDAEVEHEIDSHPVSAGLQLGAQAGPGRGLRRQRA